MLGAYAVASEPIAYIASMTFGIIFLYLLIPAVIILFIGAAAAASLNKVKYAAAFVVSCVMLPVFFLGGLQAMRAVGWARYEEPGVNDMRPIGSELKYRIVVTFKKTATQEDIHRFGEDILRKKIPQPNGVLLEFADGVCNFSYSQMSPEVTIVDVPFCADATEDEKARIRQQIISSPLIETAYEYGDAGVIIKLK